MQFKHDHCENKILKDITKLCINLSYNKESRLNMCSSLNFKFNFKMENTDAYLNNISKSRNNEKILIKARY